MSEFIDTTKKNTASLLEFARGLMTGLNVPALIMLHKEAIDAAKPEQVMEILDNLITEGFSVAEVKDNVGKILNVLYKSLNSFEWEKPGAGHFLYYLMLENREVEKRMHQLKELTKRFFKGKDEDQQKLIQSLKDIVNEINVYELHYLKKENILFPYIEKTFPSYRCLSIMWSFHDDFRQTIKELEILLSEDSPARDKLNKLIGKLFFTVLPVIFREEQIVFPVAYRAITEEGWKDMLYLSNETGWSYIVPPSGSLENEQHAKLLSGLIDLGTGSLTASQIMLILNNLPVDITFVDENDEVRYFSEVRHKIFPRSKAIIGRKVQNCHPHDSVEIVNRILKSFREGKKDHADFWITPGGRFIHIRYFALRDTEHNYKGTIEVSQDVTEIRSLEGERRLLQWK